MKTITTTTWVLVCIAAGFLVTAPATAQDAKQLRTKKGTSVALVNLLNARPDCSSNAGPIAIPVVREKPANGSVQMTILVGNVAASANCPARKVPMITLIYTPNPDFTGSDAVAVEIEAGNKTTSLRYSILVHVPGETL